MPKAIVDKFSIIPNKQARKYFRHKERGKCARCGKNKTTAEKPYAYCTKCRDYCREYGKRHYKPVPIEQKNAPRKRTSKYYVQP